VAVKGIRAADAGARRVADSVLFSAYALHLGPARRSGAGCRRLRSPGMADLPAGGAIVVNRGPGPAGIAIARFAPPQRARRLGVLRAGGRGRIELPRDTVRVPWRVVAGGRSTLQVCPA
jgi:hypothetical protein